MNRAALREQFKGLLNRNDCSDALADTFIDQALARSQRNLRVPAMEFVKTITFGDVGLTDSFVLPNDFLEFIDLYHEDDRLTYLPLATFLRQPKGKGQPKFFTRVGAGVQVRPVPEPGTELTLYYYRELPDFTAEDSTNYLSVAAPEVLLYGALSYACDYFVDERKAGFEEVFTNTLIELDTQAKALEMSMGGMTMQSPYGSEY